MTHVVVIGNGMAGHRVAAETHRRGTGVRVTVVGGEPRPAYNRVLLTNLLAGRATEESIDLPGLPPEISVRTGRTALAVDPSRRTVTLDDGDVLRYDRLVLATGSLPFVPPVKRLARDDGRLLPGVVPFRTLDDCRQIMRLAGTGARALVLGGGLLGIEAARGLAQRGLDVQILHVAPHLMERQLDGPGGRMLAASLAELGIRALTGIDVVAATGGDRFTGVQLADGRTVPGDLLVVACGTRPDTALARSAGLDTGRGVLVDAWMRTSDPSVYAVGDCAEHAGTVSGLVAAAWEQARIVADALTGAADAVPYQGAAAVTRLKAAGIDLAAMGDPYAGSHAGADAEGASGDAVEVIGYTDTRRGVYQRILLRDDRIAGAVLLGDTSTAGRVTRLFDRQEPVPRDRRLLLFPELADGGPGKSPESLPDDAVVCQCNGVTKGALLRCRADGASDLAAVAERTRATTGCGGCTSLVEELLDR
ncbi:FAD-dependent oxidoreductase [Streptomyces sp. S.PNR 29]|uniref:FAD-dependent oxidoreductase n=1 Tax=Streptomyces sp. S.PNR 29 TaxID=2973805 RepID=UPI0025B272EE|nr:FAD-dependent oxidoreductase [Streptomyces sp. S.PNR 29]MDN0200490.1 FAD-dependent oxidoreductase [Streptomyces sp. S.PNR 29]